MAGGVGTYASQTLSDLMAHMNTLRYPYGSFLLSSLCVIGHIHEQTPSQFFLDNICEHLIFIG